MLTHIVKKTIVVWTWVHQTFIPDGRHSPQYEDPNGRVPRRRRWRSPASGHVAQLQSISLQIMTSQPRDRLDSLHVTPNVPCAHENEHWQVITDSLNYYRNRRKKGLSSLRILTIFVDPLISIRTIEDWGDWKVIKDAVLCWCGCYINDFLFSSI